MGKYIIRMDDISPGMKWNNFERYRKLFDEYNIKPLIGVIPNNKDETLNISKNKKDFWEYIKRLAEKGWIIAQHGYEHLPITKSGGILGVSTISEFASLNYQEQYSKILDGRKIFKQNGLKSDIFMAPSHSFDETTLSVLQNLKFKFVTDGYGIFPYKHKGIIFVPQLFSMPISLPVGIYTTCIHSNFLDETRFKKLEDFIQKENRNIINFYESERYINETIMSKIIYRFTETTLKLIRYSRRRKI